MGAKPQTPPSPALASPASQQESVLQVGCSSTPIPSIRHCKLQDPPCSQTVLSPCHLSETLKNFLLLYREEEEVSDQLLGRIPHSIEPSYWAKTPDPFYTCLGFSSQPAGEFSAGRPVQDP